MNQDQKSSLIGNLACFTAYAIFGFNIISCKSIALDGNVTPMALFCLRSFGATALFWLWSLFTAPHRTSTSTRKMSGRWSSPPSSGSS